MSPCTRSRAEWVTRYAQWLDRLAGGRMEAEDSRRLAEYEYDEAFDASPEETAARLMAGRDEVAELAAAEYSAAILLRKVRARGFRILQGPAMPRATTDPAGSS